MTGPVERVPLADEQLDEMWDWCRRGHQDSIAEAYVLVLVTELRASRAREQEALTDAEDMRQHFLTANAATQENARQMWAARVERDDLQQRIDKALTECDGLAKIIQSFTSDADARSTVGGASAAIAAVRAALTGTEPIRSMADPDRAVD